MQPVTINITINVHSDGSVSVKTPQPVKTAVIDDEPIPPIDSTDPYSTPGVPSDDPYGVNQPKAEAKITQPAEPTDALTELARSLVWLDSTQDPMAVGKTLLEFHPDAAKELAKANSVEELDKIVTGIGTTKASEAGGRIRENAAWSGRLMVRLRVGLGMPMPTGLKPETPAAEAPKPEETPK